jgi:putative ABC transport system substrate-binding protein
MRRRTFIAALGVAASWPVAARSQLYGRIPRLGVLLYSTPKDDPQARALQQGLRDHGYIDGQNISVDYRFAEGMTARLPELASDLVRMKPTSQYLSPLTISH